MFAHIKTRKLVEAVVLSAGLLFAAGSVSAATVAVDGDLTDLISATGSVTFNKVTGTDPLGSADTPNTESNSGYDIKDVYAYYNFSVDTLYLGMNFYGNVGDSLDKDSTAPCERTIPSVLCSLPNSNRAIFDANETYRFSIFQGTDTSGPHLLQYYVLGNDNGSDAATIGTNPHGLTVTHAVSESFNGVEFGITGLWTTGALTGFPSDLHLFFGAGSGEPNPTSVGAEDSYSAQMTVVPVPAAVWLFASGLVGLAGLVRHKAK